MPTREFDTADFGDDWPAPKADVFNPNCILTLFEGTHLRGKFVTLTESLRDLASKDFDNKLMSVKVEGSCKWDIFTEPNFKGEKETFNADREYKSVADIQKVMRKASSANKHPHDVRMTPN